MAALVAGLLVLSSCDRQKDDVMSTIPGDVSWVAKVNADKIMASAGITREGTEYKLSKTLEELSHNLSGREQEVLDKLMSLMPAIDTENIYAYMTADKEMILTCLMEHKSQLVEALTDKLGDPETEGDFSVYEINNDVLALRGNQLWIADKTGYITDAVKNAADNGSIADEPGYRRYLDSDKAVTYISDCRAMARMLNGNGIPVNVDDMSDKMAMYIDLERESMILGCIGFDNDGSEKPIADYKVNSIEKDGLVYVPDNAIATIAIGSFREGMIADILNQAGVYDRQVKEILEGINGTMTMSVVPPSDVNDLLKAPAWNLVISIGMEADAADKVMGAVEQFMQPAEVNGMKVLDLGSPYMMGGGKIYYRYFNDGYLAGGTMPVSDDNDCKLVKDMAGQMVALHAYESKNGDIARAFDMPWGIDLNTRETGNSGEIVLTLEGSDRPFIDAILALVADRSWQRNAMKRLEEMY